MEFLRDVFGFFGARKKLETTLLIFFALFPGLCGPLTKLAKHFPKNRLVCLVGGGVRG